jgi:hypothetical protein
MFAAAGRAAAGRAAAGGSRLRRLGREGLSHINSRNLENKETGSGIGSKFRSFDFMKALREANTSGGHEKLQKPERLQKGEEDRSSLAASPPSSVYSDALRMRYNAEQARDTNPRSTSNHEASSEVSSISDNDSVFDRNSHNSVSDNNSIHSNRSEASEEQAEATSHELVLRRPREINDDASETSSISEFSIDFDRDAHVSETSSISEFSVDFDRDGYREPGRRSGNGSEGSTESERPDASAYAEHLEKDGPNKLRKDRERAEENDRKLKEFLKKGLDFIRDPNWNDPANKQMNKMMSTQSLMIAAGDMEHEFDKLAPNTRL